MYSVETYIVIFRFNISWLAVVAGLWAAPAIAIEVAPETLNCESPPQSAAPAEPETGEERTARLNWEFEQSLRYFDRCIAMINQDDYASAGSSGPGGTSGTGTGGGQASNGGAEQSENADGTESAAQASAEGSSEDGGESDEAPQPDQSASVESRIEGSGAGSVPSDIPQGDDDDIVAQQLRQAAMETTAPEARERLWNDYRKYKGIDE